MGKRKLAGFFRRSVTSGISRVTKGIAGAFRSHEGQEAAEESTKEPATQHKVNDELQSSTVEFLPVTKVPALDTVDHYVIETSSADCIEQSQRVELIFSSDLKNTIDSLIKGYARFISSFTGLEEIAFVLLRPPFVLGSLRTRSIIRATITPRDDEGPTNSVNTALQELDIGHHDRDGVQFFLEIGLRDGGLKNVSTTTGKFFKLFIEPYVNTNTLQISFAYPKVSIPKASVTQLLRILACYLADSSPTITLTTPPPEPSALNFPPLTIPPPRGATQKDECATSHAKSFLLHNAFEDWARRTPDAIALDFVHALGSETTPAEHSTLTYAALNEAASNLAIRIRSLLSASGKAADRGHIIPVHMSTSPELYISYLGILKSGCAFSPLPQDAPAKRVSKILQDIGSPIILGNKPEPQSGPWNVDAAIGERKKAAWIDVAEVSKWKELRNVSSISTSSNTASVEQLDIESDQTAYLLYTSGSTGWPKGVQISHMAGTCSIESHIAAIPLPGDSTGDFRWFQFASPSFDPSIMEIFVTLSMGATLCSADRALTLTNLEATINETRATVMMATPSLAALLRPSRLTTLQSLWSMGEKLNRTVIENFTQAPNACRSSNDTDISRTLVNAYGPTEGAINCTFAAPFEYATRGSIIGKPLPTCAIFILSLSSRTPKLVPTGLVGELAIGGPQVSKGYLNLASVTAKSFVQSDEFGYIYRTGDKARIVWDGTGAQVVEYLGRITADQVKVSGRRVELGEVESVIAAVSGVREVVAAVLTRENGLDNNEQIVACIVANDKCETAKDNILKEAQRNARDHLPPSMCPSRYTFFDSLPKSSSGKVDRTAISAFLLQPQKTGAEACSIGNNDTIGTQSKVLENTVSEIAVPLQRLLIKLIAETMGESVSAVNLSDDLYSMGMDSLAAMKLLEKLRDHAITGLSIGDVLRSQTPEVLLSIITENQRLDSELDSNGTRQAASQRDNFEQNVQSFAAKNHQTCAERLEIAPDTIDKVLPATATQCGMIASFLHSLANSSSSSRTYINHSVLPLNAHVDLERMKIAWETVLKSNDAFRTVFCLADDNMSPFAQCILAPQEGSGVDWEIYNVSDDDLEETILNVLRNAEESINLNTPPWKLSIVSSAKCSKVILSMFHGILDGGALKLLLQDVSSAYEGKPWGQRTSLEYIVRHHFEPDHQSTFQFWAECLKGFSPTAFPSLTPYQTPPLKRTECVEITSLTGYGDLKRRSKSIGSTPLSVLQAAWSSILLSYTGTSEQDVVMGSAISGRFGRNSEFCIGPVFTIIPVRVSIEKIKENHAGATTNKDVTRYLSSFNAAALSHLQPRLGSIISANGQVPYDTVLVYQESGAESNGSGLWSTIVRPPMGIDFAVMIEVIPEPDMSLTFRATFNTKLDASSAELMLREMDAIVNFILEEPDKNFNDAPFHTQPCLKSALNSEPKAAAEVRNRSLLHSQFEEHAKLNPEALALIFKRDLDNDDHPGNIAWTYAQLNAMAENLAEHLLQTCGQLTNVSVPICIEKSPELYVAILGVLKAGGAWCPIDTLSPTQRRHDLIARTSAGVVLISQMDGQQPEDAIPANTKVVDVCNFSNYECIYVDAPKQNFTNHRATPNDMAYLIWTSGTTGAPKGVPITHSAAVSSMRSLQHDIPGNADGGIIRCLQFSQCTFDVSIQDLFYTWGLGGVLISATRDIMLESFSKLANLTRATHAHLTPAFAAGVPRKSCKTLKVITMIGEKLTQSVADDWGTDIRAFNTYGPAEVTVVSTIREFGNEHKSIKSANIGWPMESVSVFVTKNQRVLMKNAIGELALGGPQLSPGYLKQEEVTRAKYIWNQETSQKLYYTGDLVRMLADGSLEYITRVDDLVKLGGIRVELSEISFALRGCHPLAQTIETLVLSRPDRPTQVLVAFLSAPEAADEGDARNLLLLQGNALEIARAAANQARNSLPEYMIPSVFLVVRKIPKTPSAKVDRRALQDVYASVDLDRWEGELNIEDGAVGYTSENGLDLSIYTQIIEIVATLVEISPSIITKANRLRSLGLDSIRATRLVSRLKKAGYKLSVIEALSCITIQDLVQIASSSIAIEVPISSTFNLTAFNNEWHEVATKKVQDDFIVAPATAIQESFLSETMGSYDMYWSNHFFSLDPSVNIPRLKQAWFAVCQKTEALRIGFLPVAETGRGNPDQDPGFSILQLIYKLPTLDWEHYSYTSSQNWTELFRNRIKRVMTKHQSNYFRHPPWAVTILDKETERYMALSLHHSIHDEPSLRFIMDDVRSSYAYKPPLRQQFSNVLATLLPHEYNARETLRFWRTELESFAELDTPAWPDLTGKRVSPGVVRDYQLISEEVQMTEPITRLQSIAANLGLQSIASIIRVAWSYVSLSYLGLPATVFAETLSDRVLDSAFEDSVGPLISVIPIPFNPKGSAREVLLEQHRISVQSRKYRHVHAREIRKVLKRPRGEPLYPAVFNFHGTETISNEHSRPNIWSEVEDQIGLHVEHPMAMNVFCRNDGCLVLEASSDSRLMSRNHLRLFVHQVDSLISAISESPDESLVSLVNRLPASMRSISNQPVSEEVASAIHTAPTYWLELYAKSKPDWTAVEVARCITSNGIEKEAMTFGALNAAANRVAAFISSFGHKNRVIGVCCGRTMASYPIITGIFKSGNTYLPIDEGLPAERKTYLSQDGDCPLIFTELSLSDSFSGVSPGCKVLCLDDSTLSESLSKMPSYDQDYKSRHDDNAYLLFTSGSTGKPKGVMVTRGNLSAFIESISEFACRAAPRTLQLGGTGRYLAQANRAFDPHLLEMFFPWRHGMATVTAPRPMILDDLGLTLSKWDITHASFVPSLVDQSNITPYQCPKLVFMTVGGEKISQKVLDTWASASQVAIVNAYGPTEVTIGCTFAHINEHTNLKNIGPPLSACVGHVLIPGSMDYALRGQAGELCFTGNLVAKGYLNRPDAAGFVTGPCGEKMYRTGDIGRLMIDDSMEYLGRGDDQTKIRGQRLELGEVSEVLRASSAIEIDVVTTVAKHPGLVKDQLIAFIARSGSRNRAKNPDEIVTFLYSDFSTLGRELQEICRKKLPAYMVPDLVLPISFIPVAQISGKANIKELHGLFTGLPLQTVLQGNNSTGVNGTTHSRPLNSDEEAIVNEICKVVSTDPSCFGPMTNIFEIGLDSLSAIGLSIRLRNIGYAATVAAVMSNPVIEQLASLPRSSVSSKEDNTPKFNQRVRDLESQYLKNFPIAATISPRHLVQPCLPLQEGLVARSINSDGNQLYVNHIALELEDSVDGNKLKLSWQNVTDSNDIMRTTFTPLEQEIVQVVFPAPYPIQWMETESHSLIEAVNEQELQQRQISRNIISNISSVPPIRFQLVRSSTTKNPLALFISIHHALYDGESFSMLLDDAATVYEGNQVSQRGSPSAFIEHVYNQDMERARQYWTEYLSNRHPASFRSKQNVVEQPMAVQRTIVNKLTELESCASGLQTTVPTLIQAIFALLIADSLGISDVTYGIVLSGRTVSIPGAASVLLPCITTIPGRLTTDTLRNVTDVIAAVQKSNVRSLEFQHTPLRYIQRWLNSEMPLFDCLYSYVRTVNSSRNGLWKELDNNMPSEYPLALEVEANQSMNAIRLNCVFSTSFGSLYYGEEFLEKMETILSSIVSGETPSLESFNLSHSENLGSKARFTQWDNTSWSPTEAKIRQLTEDFCGLNSTYVSKGASFLSLGIDSVTSIQFAQRLRQLGLHVTSSAVMRFPCVGALAQHVDEATTEHVNGVNGIKEGEKVSIPVELYGKYIRLLSSEDSVSSMFQCTPLQSGMITQTISSSGKTYIHPHPIQLNHSVDIGRFKASLHQVMRENDIFRTSFHIIDDIGNFWVGAVHENPPFWWEEINLPPDANVISEVMALVSLKESRDFENPPVYSVLVNQPGSRTVVIIMHHSLYDGASLPFLFEDLVTIYHGQAPNHRPQFSEVVGHTFSGQEKSCEFWIDKLRGYRTTEIPPLPESESSSQMLLGEQRISLDLLRITDLCKEMEVTVQSIALLAYAKVFACLVGERDVVFGQVLAGRGPDTDRTIGPLFNTVAQRVKFETKFLSNQALALELQQHTAEAQVHQNAPLRVVQNSLRGADGLNSTSLFESLFVFQKSASLADGPLDKQDIWSPFKTEDYAAEAEYKLNVEVDHEKDGIVLRAICNGQYISQQMLDNFLDDLDSAFCDIIEHPTRWAAAYPDRLGKLPLRKNGPSENSATDIEAYDTPTHEPIIRSVLAEVAGLPLENIKPDTSIFNIGLDSLSAIRIASLCRSRGLKTGVGDILQGNTLRGISQRTKYLTSHASPTQILFFKNFEQTQKMVLETIELNMEAIEAILPCLPGQVYHLASWLKSGRTMLEPAWPFFSTQRLDGDKLMEAWFKLIQRHTALRTCFAATSSSEVVQVILKHGSYDAKETFKVIESGESITVLAKRQAHEEAKNPSSLFTPPVRLRLLKASDKDGIVILINHAAYDAWTMPIFVSELEKLYRGQPLDSSPDFSSFVDFSLQTLHGLDEKAYWTSTLGLGTPTFIQSSKNPSARTAAQVYVSAWGKVKNVSQMESVCRSAGLSLQTIVLLALSRCIAQITGVKSPIMGLYQTGRSASFNNIERLSGPCLNVTPLMIPNAIPDGPESQFSSIEQARKIQASLAERVSYEQSSLRDILHWVNAQTPGAPLFNTWINLLWMQNAIPSANDATPETALVGNEALFLPLRIGDPTDFVPTEPLPNSPTPVAILDTSFIPDENVFIDIGPDPKTDTLGFGVRVEGGALTEDEVHQLVEDIARQIEAIISLL